MMLGIGHLAVKVIEINKPQQFIPDFLCALIEIQNILAIAGSNNQIGQRLKFLGLPEGGNQRTNVLARIRA